MLIINADDWGKNVVTTDNSLTCFKNGRITSVSAMMFMEDSERSAGLASENNIDAGLHLNFTEPFSRNVKLNRLNERQQRIASFLTRNKYCLLLYNPLLARDFQYVYSAQYEEYVRLYSTEPTHIDGHHHMHLSTNVLLQRMISKNTKVRRNFSFAPEEKNFLNRLYRSLVDIWLQRRYVCTDFFFSISPINRADRIRRIVKLSQSHNVEVMVHPQKQDEYEYLMSDEYWEVIHGAKIGTYKAL